MKGGIIVNKEIRVPGGNKSSCSSFGKGWDSELDECRLCEKRNPDVHMKCKELNETIYLEDIEAFPYNESEGRK